MRRICGYFTRYYKADWPRTSEVPPSAVFTPTRYGDMATRTTVLRVEHGCTRLVLRTAAVDRIVSQSRVGTLQSYSSRVVSRSTTIFSIAMVAQQPALDKRSKCHGQSSSRMTTRRAPSATVSARRVTSSAFSPQENNIKSSEDATIMKEANSKIALVGEQLPSSCRGFRLLMKAKEFHLAARGLKETTGFQYMAAQPPR